jgi:protocatechuate 3,4-dioxygenase beta subunit
MKSALLLLTILLLTVPVSAQPIAGTAAEKCTVEGQVVAAGTGAPLRKARVLLRKAEARAQPVLAVTDAAGRFLFSEIEPGRYYLSVQRNGYVRQTFGQRGPNRSETILSLAPGQHVRDVVFRLVRQAVITGRVYDEDGEPVPEVNVGVLRYLYVSGERQLTPVGMDSTNDLGEYRIYGLAPGRYYVSATYQPSFSFPRARAQARRRGTGGQSAGDEGYAPTYYPGTSDPSRAAPIDLRAGDELSSMDFTLLPTRAVSVRGRVFNSITAKPGRGAILFLLPREQGVRSFSARQQTDVMDSDGTFEIAGVVPGSYTLTAFYFDGRKRYTARQPIEVGNSDVEGISLVIGPGVDVAGRIYVEGGAPAGQQNQVVAGGQKQEQFEMTEARVYLQPFDNVPRFGGVGSGRAQEGGSFTLENVPHDRYRINVFGLPRDYYLKAARVGGQDVLEEGLDLSLGPPSGPLEITISGAGGRIDGSVLTEEQRLFGGASVVLVPEERRRDQRRFYKTTTTDQHGRFVLRGIPPGDYKLFAWEEIERGAYQDAAFLRPYEDRGEPVEVEGGSRLSVQLHLIPADGPPR